MKCIFLAGVSLKTSCDLGNNTSVDQLIHNSVFHMLRPLNIR